MALPIENLKDFYTLFIYIKMCGKIFMTITLKARLYSRLAFCLRDST